MDEIRSTRAPTLRDDQIEILRRYGQKRKTEIGDVLFRAGDTQNDFIVILEGEVEVVDDFAGDARTIGVFLAGHSSRAAEGDRHRGAQSLGRHPEGLPG